MNIAKVGAVDDRVKSRSYRSPARQESARRTRMAILTAAGRLFSEQGYTGTTVAQIAATAAVSIDTVYSSVGPKPAIFRLLLETAISGTDEAVPAEQREYVKAIRAARRGRDKLRIYAAAVGTVAGRMAPLHLVLRDAAAQDADLASLRDEIAARRARNMRLFAEDLIASGDMRPELSADEIADVVWSTSAAEFYTLLVRERGWSLERYEEWLADTWCDLFLRAPRRRRAGSR
jgi:AcrR family transcriptional regulator